jgi:regulation of enolase protein 1 (concanavalin A-like superfamily)/fibronectin type 3 domain-containing protein
MPSVPSNAGRFGRVFPFVLVVFFASMFSAWAQSARDTVLEVTATTSATTPCITLNWITPGGVTVTAQKLWRRVKGSTSWGTEITLAASDISYPDPTAVAGVTYEYSLQRTRSTSPTTVYGSIVAGVNVPLVETRGNVCLLVDGSLSAQLITELGQLVNDLVADGWKVFRHDVARQVASSASAVTTDWPTRIADQLNIRSIVQTDYNSAPTAEWALLIIGRVPVPYSGELNPDGHPDHRGAWPTDGYYADVDGNWTDTSVNNTVAGDARNDNVPNDGKFDQSYFPTTLELQAGRVDLSSMTGVPTGQTEAGLLRQYLTRDHRFRRGEGPYASVAARALIDDNFGYFGGETFSNTSWRAAISLFGRSAGQVDALDWFGTLGTTPVLFAHGCGGGSFTSAGGIGTSTLDFGRSDSKAVFTNLFGSYFGDWDITNNFLRAPLAGTQDSLGLVCAWSGRGQVHFNHLAMGETIGYAIRYTQNSNGYTFNGDWFQNGSGRGVQVNLMGDPTLRLHTVKPPTGLFATTATGMTLSWQASPDATGGYHVYRAATSAGPFTRLTGGAASASDPMGSPISGTTYTDLTATNGTSYVYQVKAVRMSTSMSGTYANQSLGESVTATAGGAAPSNPTRLTVTGTSTTNYNLAWDDNATSETGYQVQRRTSGVWSTIATLGANVTSYTDPTAISAGPNFYRVCALGTPNSAYCTEAVDQNRPGIARTQDYTLVSESAGTFNYGVMRFSGNLGPGSVNWTASNVMSSAGDYTGTSGSLAWTNGQSGAQNISFGITNYGTPQLTKIFQVAIASPSGVVLGSPTTGYLQISDSTSQTVPAPWSTQAVGSVTAAGYSEHVSGTFGISAVTGVPGSTADSFRSISQQVTGDCRITARIAARSNVASTTRAGIMIRSDLAAAANAVMCSALTTSSTAIQRAYRTATGATADTALAQSSLALPLWLRLTRTGNDIALEYSSNGTAWTAFGTPVTLSTLGASPYVSLVMGSNTSAPAIYGYAQFDNVLVQVAPTVPTVTLNSGSLPGDIGLNWPDSSGAEGYIIERSTTSGSGYSQIAQVTVPGYADRNLTIGQTYYYRVKATTSLFQSAYSTESSAVPYNPPSVDGWRYRYFGTTNNTGNAADNADPDHDGMCNLIECGTGQLPMSASSAVPAVGRTTASGNDYLTLTFIRDTTVTGLQFQVESDDDLSGTWTTFDPLAPANQLSVQNNTPSTGLQTITVKDIQPVPPGGKRFIRLRVTRP